MFNFNKKQNMKKSIAILAISAFAFNASAQELTSKKGFPILPEAGDWSLSFDAVPFLDYAFDKTRFMSATPATSAAGALNYNVANTIVGKYMKDANTAYRGIVRVGFNRTSIDNYVSKDGSTTGEEVVDNAATTTSNITLGAGMQWYRGKGRLRGYYGAEALLGIASGPSTTITYGNAYSTTNPTPTSTTSFISGTSSPVGSRFTETKSGMGFNIGARGFVGAEYFFAPKMSIGAEFGWGLGLNSVSDGEAKSDTWNGTAVQSNTSKLGGISGFNMDVDNAGGSINLAIYF
jgi:hypothetical protein